MKLATIERIVSIKPIIGADLIELVEVQGWNVVVSKGDYNIGDLCVYIPIDTQIDPSVKGFERFVTKSGNLVRINTKKIRGVYSQGLVMKFTDFDLSVQTEIMADLTIGTDVSKFIGVTKFSKDLPDTNSVSSNSKPFPIYIIDKTDEDNLRTKKNCLQELINKPIYITKKMDGSSMTIIKKSGSEILVCSRNLIVEPTHAMYLFYESKLKSIIENMELTNIAIQGEYCGPKVNGNKLNLKTFEYYIFNVKDLSTNKYYSLDELEQFVTTHGLQMVPLIDKFVCPEEMGIQEFQDIANKVTYCSGSKSGEGIVIRPQVPVYSEVLGKNLSCKVINQEYKD
jgi:RNA ligase (TIGR02306 family)